MRLRKGCSYFCLLVVAASVAGGAWARAEPPPVMAQLLWKWSASTIESEFTGIMTTPLVGDIDRDGFSDVVVVAFRDVGKFPDGVLRVLDARTGVEKWSLGDPAKRCAATTTPAIADIDMDGNAEIYVVAASRRQVYAIRHDGSLKWVSDDLEPVLWGGISVADLDGDGTAELLVGRQALDALGHVLWTGAAGTCHIPIAADLDGDGMPEVICGNTAYRSDGSTLWQNSAVPDVAPPSPERGTETAGPDAAVADFDRDGRPEIAVAAGGDVWLLRRDGALLWRASGLDAWGPPTIADFNGDGTPEIAVSGYQHVTVVDARGRVVWSAASDDSTSGSTGIAAFDFDGDGAWEVVHRDQRQLRIFDGATGTARFSAPLGSGTAHESPSISDIDHDGSPEILVGGDNQFAASAGLYAWRAAAPGWPATRSVWNQHAYAITNITDELQVPAVQAAAWATPELRPHNMFRGQSAEDGQPDLSVGSVDASQLSGDWQRLEIDGEVRVTLLNHGGRVQTAFRASVFEDLDGDLMRDSGSEPELGAVTLASMDGYVTKAAVVLVQGSVRFRGAPLTVVVDSLGQVQEAREDNNAAVSSDYCLLDPVPSFGEFSPVLRYRWKTAAEASDSVGTYSLPIVMDIDLDGHSEILFVTNPDGSGATGTYGYVRIVDGASGVEKASWVSTDRRFASHCALAAGDLDGDGRPEIVGMDPSQTQMICLGSDGAVRWRSEAVQFTEYGSPTIADLDADGVPEILLGRQVLDATGRRLWGGAQGNSTIAVAADVRLDVAGAEVVCGDTLYSAVGAVLWTNTPAPGSESVDAAAAAWNAVADFDGDGQAEIVTVHRGNVSIRESADGTLRWRSALGVSGPPTLADLDGDGLPEILAAGATSVAAIDRWGSLLWRATVSDPSGVGGVGAFDLDGDGAAEVLHRDASTLRILSGKTGAPLFSYPVGSATWTEYPVVADLDGDGSSEVVIGGDRRNGDFDGLFVFGDAHRRWMPSRSVWNQHAYSITNVDDHGVIPAQPESNWLFPGDRPYNSFRRSVIAGGTPLSAPDLTASWIRAAVVTGAPSVIVRIGNGGRLSVSAGVPVSLYEGDPRQGGTLLRTTWTIDALSPGTFVDLAIELPDEAAAGGDFFVVADDAGRLVGTIRECDEENNLHAYRRDLVALGRYDRELALELGPTTFDVQTGRLLADVRIVNQGSFPIDAPVRLVCESFTTLDVALDEPDGFQASGAAYAEMLSVSAAVPTIESGEATPWRTLSFRDRQELKVFFASTLVARVNRPPVIVTTPSDVGTPGQSYTYDAAAVDPEAQAVRFEMVAGPAGMTIEGASGLLQWTPAGADVGLQDVVIAAVDSRGGRGEQSFSILVDASLLNRPPAFAGNPLTFVRLGDSYLYDADARDPDGDGLLFTLAQAPTGMSMDAGTGVVSWASPTQGRFPVTVRVADGRGGVASQQFELGVGVASDTPGAPWISGTPRTWAVVGAAYRYQPTGHDPEGRTLAWTLPTKPAGMTVVAASGEVLWTPTPGQLGRHRVVVSVTDQDGGGAGQEWDIDVVSTAPNQPPAFVTLPVRTVTRGSTYLYSARATDPEGGAVTYTLLSGPPGLAIAASGDVTGTPTSEGTFLVEIRAADAAGLAARQRFGLAVSRANGSPTITSLAPDQAAVGSTYLYDVKAIDPDVAVGDTVRFSLREHPGAMVIDARTGRLLWNPRSDDVGPHAVTIVAMDALGASATQTWTLTVFVPSPDDQPAITIVSPDPGSELMLPTPLVATITTQRPGDPGNASLAWTVELGRAELGDWVTIGSGRGEVTAGVVARIDPTVLLNDGYTVRVKAFQHGLGYLLDVPYAISGNLKLGNLRLSFTDLSVPFPGLPIQVSRTYDSLDLSLGDFGYGWRMGMIGSVRDSADESTGEEYSTRTRVYVTKPDGRRIGFTFAPQRVSTFFSWFLPAFKPDPGVRDRLETESDLLFGTGSGTYTTLFGSFNPRRFTLTEKNGTRWVLDEIDGLISGADRNGNSLTVTSDAITHSAGVRVGLERDGLGRIRRIIDPAGNALTYEYDLAGDLASFTDQTSVKTQYTYFPQRPHLLRTIVDPCDITIFTAEFDAEGRLIASVDGLGSRTTQTFDPDAFAAEQTDARGFTTVLKYDARGNVLEERDPNGGVLRREYGDPQNPDLQTRVTDRSGAIVEYRYDGEGRLLEIERKGSAARPLLPPAVSSFEYGQGPYPIAVVDPAGARTEYSYDEALKLVRVVGPLGATTVITRDATGRRTEVVDPTGARTRYVYGGAYRTPTEIIAPDGARTLQTLDALGRVTERRILSSGGVLLSRTLLELDQRGRTTAREDGDGRRVEHDYLGGRRVRTRVMDGVSADGAVVDDLVYDEGENLVERTDGALAREQFRHDQAGNVIEIEDGIGNRSERTIDPVGHVIEERYAGYSSSTPTASRLQLTYDGQGRVVEADNGAGQRRAMEYDYAGRLVRETWFVGMTATTVLDWSYDSAGRLVRARSPEVDLRWTYDTSGRAISHVITGGTVALDAAFAMSRDERGSPVAIVEAGGATATTIYDGASRPLAIEWTPVSGTPLRAQFSYDGAGRPVRLQRGRGGATPTTAVETLWTWSVGDRLTHLVHQSAGGTPLLGWEHERDAHGRLSKVTSRGASGAAEDVAVFAYDGAGKLVSALHDAQADEAYGHDGAGNRLTSHRGAGTAVLAPGNLLVQDGDWSYEYDGAGRLTRRDRRSTGAFDTFSYDHRSRMIEFTRRSSGGVVQHSVQYAYDALDRRIRSVVDGHAIVHASLGSQAWADYEEGGALVRSYLHGPGIDRLLATYATGSGAQFVLTDARGGAAALVGLSGSVDARQSWDAYGNVVASTMPADFHFGAWGRELDPLTGMYDSRARLLDPTTGRFLTPDPLGFAGGDRNLYRYAASDPMNLSDPSGHSTMISYVIELSASAKSTLESTTLIADCILLPSIINFGIVSRALGSSAEEVAGTFLPYLVYRSARETVGIPSDIANAFEQIFEYASVSGLAELEELATSDLEDWVASQIMDGISDAISDVVLPCGSESAIVSEKGKGVYDVILGEK